MLYENNAIIVAIINADPFFRFTFFRPRISLLLFIANIIIRERSSRVSMPHLRWCSETECFFRPFLAFIHHTEGRRCNTCGLGCNIEAKRLGTQVSRTNLHKSFIRPPDAIRRGSTHISDIKPFRHPCVAPTKDSPACVTLVWLFIRLPYSLLPLFYQLIWCCDAHNDGIGPSHHAITW